MLAQSDGVSSRIDSGGRQSSVLITASTLDHIGVWSAVLETSYDDFVDAQNHTLFEVSQTQSTASCAKSNSWTTERFNPISDKLSTWTQILIIPRLVFFGPLDDGMSASFAALIFGCATILFLNMHIPSVVAATALPSSTSETNDSVQFELEANATMASPGSTTGSKRDEMDSLELSSVFEMGTGVFALDAKAHEVNGRQEGGSCAAEEEDPVILMSQDPESLSSNLKGDVRSFQRLHRFSWLQLQPTVTALKADPEKADCKLVDRAAEYAILAVRGFFVYTLVLTEQRYGRGSVQCKLFRWLNGSWAFSLRRAFSGLFLLAVFLPTDSTEQRVLDIIILTVISCFTVAWAFYQWVQLNGGGLRALTWVHISFLGLTWVALILQQLGVAPVLGLMRPWPLLLSSETLIATLRVFSICVGDISTILAFAFFSVCTSGIALFVLYEDRLDRGGTTIHSFVDSFVASFIFMESADNWEGLVYNAYKVSKASRTLKTQNTFQTNKKTKISATHMCRRRQEHLNHQVHSKQTKHLKHQQHMCVEGVKNI